MKEEIRAFNHHRRKIAETAVFVENNRVIDMKVCQGNVECKRLVLIGVVVMVHWCYDFIDVVEHYNYSNIQKIQIPSRDHLQI